MSDLNVEGIEKALDDGMVVRASAGGCHVRVVEISDPNKQGSDAVKVHGEMTRLDYALERVSDAYQHNVQMVECPVPIGVCGSNNPVDNWVFHGHKLYAKRTNGKVTLEARSWDNILVVTVQGRDFHAAYSALFGKIDQAAFEKAERFD
jgi:hypothetical protein